MLELEYIFGLGKVYSHRFIESEICLQLFEYETETEHRKRTPGPMIIKKSTNSTPKLISDSAFRIHLSFYKHREIINLSDLKLKTHTSNSGSWRCYAGGGKRNENRDSIKCGKRKGGKLDGPMQCY